VQELFAVLRSLVDGAMAVVVVEQHAEAALALARRALVMERGRLVHDGPAAELAADRTRLAAMLAL
jgi:branched-chain amino acid transport system ATP-binding protein